MPQPYCMTGSLGHSHFVFRVEAKHSPHMRIFVVHKQKINSYTWLLSSGHTSCPNMSFGLTNRVCLPLATLLTMAKSSSLNSTSWKLLLMRAASELLGSTA